MLILTPIRKKTGFDGQRQHKWTFTSLSQASDPWSSESSTTYVTLQLIPGQNSFDWGASLEPGPDSEEFLLPPVHPTPPEKKVGFKTLLGHFKHWNRDFVIKSTLILGYFQNRQVHLETLELSGGDWRWGGNPITERRVGGREDCDEKGRRGFTGIQYSTIRWVDVSCLKPVN